MNNVMVSLQQVTRVFANRPAVNNISFTVDEGENFILLGTSGCGKTTTLKMINRLIDATQGTIIVNGKNILDQPAEQLRRKIGYVVQHNTLFPHYTVAENIAVVPNLLSWDKVRTNTRIVTLIEKLHLSSSLLNVYPAQLSGGEAQRVNLARALVADPPILLMDEPFGALDTITRTAIRKEFSQLDELKRKTIVMVTHDVQEAFEMGSRICLMDNGRIMQTGKPAELLFRPYNNFVREFFSEAWLQLCFIVVRLADVWQFLVDEPAPEDVFLVEVTPEYSLSKAMQLIKDKHEKRTMLVVKDNTSNKKIITSEGILYAFSEYQRNQ
ncbi:MULTISPECIES: ATP-binding cassette domain-containing protein [Niastella]|uniref:ABC transporter ATP-binding protein n=1 Tax=Niastella soli TaxID=2821487 RepID=A0ABS3YX39_9BACT|nr:ABC transporter ATP-binding protein [Niastella soli]MBO9202477.1 ABC transporter ATP-binding protein [Niastella soli]